MRGDLKKNSVNSRVGVENVHAEVDINNMSPIKAN